MRGSRTLDGNGEASRTSRTSDRLNQTQHGPPVGGFLGIGDNEVAAPLARLQLGEDEPHPMATETEEQLHEEEEY